MNKHQMHGFDTLLLVVLFFASPAKDKKKNCGHNPIRDLVADDSYKNCNKIPQRLTNATTVYVIMFTSNVINA